MKTFTFEAYGQNFEVYLVKSQYVNNNALAILAINAVTHEPFCNVTVNVPGWVKVGNLFTLSVNNGSQELFKVLEEEGIYVRTGEFVPSGFVDFPICRLTEKGIEALEELK